MIKYFTIEDLLKHYLQKKFHILVVLVELEQPGFILIFVAFIQCPSIKYILIYVNNNEETITNKYFT